MNALGYWYSENISIFNVNFVCKQKYSRTQSKCNTFFTNKIIIIKKIIKTYNEAFLIILIKNFNERNKTTMRRSLSNKINRLAGAAKRVCV